MQQNFSVYLKNIESVFQDVFQEKYGDQEFSSERKLSPEALNRIMELKSLSVAVPEEFGGRGGKVKECLALLSAASYESLSLSLIFGINIALFLEPIAKYAQNSVKDEIFKNFLEKQKMGGLMITEPDYGSDALNMQTYNEKVGSGYHIKGTKHWQGLTGMADYWLITSRKKESDGKLNRDIDFFICDVAQKNQQIEVTQFYNNLGLHLIPYGENKVDIIVPEAFKLEAKSSGLKMMLDVLHRSRMQFPGMAVGFIKRMLDEAIKHCNERVVGGKKLNTLDQVQHQISKIQSAFTIASAMCFRSSTKSSIENDLSGEGIEANTMKAFVTDLMQEASQTFMQLSGANGYRMNNIGGRGVMDSRPFQVFEGSNEMLYTQIAEMMGKLMKRKKEFNLYKFLKEFPLTEKSCAYFKKDIDFTLITDLSQRKMVDLGKIYSRIIAADFVLEIQKNGFRKDLVSNCLEIIQAEVSILVSSFRAHNTVIPVVAYREKGSWYDLV